MSSKMLRSKEDNDYLIWCMYTEILVQCLATMNNVQVPSLNIYPLCGGKYCDGSFDPTGPIKSSKIYIHIPMKSNLRTLKEDLEITVIHEFGHYLHHCALGTDKARKADMEMYLDSTSYCRKDERENWLRTRKLAKQLRLWNKNSLAMCLKAATSAKVLK